MASPEQEAERLAQHAQQIQDQSTEDEAPAVSILDRLRANRQEIAGEHHLDLEVPGYEGFLVARYKVLPFKALEESEKKVRKEKGGAKLLNLAMDQIILACEMILVREPGHPACIEETDLRPIDVEAYNQGAPVKWESRLADILEIPKDEHNGNARLVVKAVMKVEPSIVQHSTKVGIWLKDVSKDVDEDFLGEL